MDNPQDLLLQAWKRQLDAALGMLEALSDGAIRLREAQLEAAAETHADLEATRKALAAAPDLAQLTRVYAAWMQGSAEKSLAYWRSVSQAVMETDAALARCAWGGMAIPLPDALKAVDFRQWLDATQRFYQPFEKAA